MTVAELIEELEQYDEDAEVIAAPPNHPTVEIESVRELEETIRLECILW